MNLSLNRFLGFASQQHAARGNWLVPSRQTLQTIDKGATLVVVRPLGLTVTCTCGDLWITHDGDSKDVLLTAGQTYTSERAGRMLVHGLAASAVRLA